MLKIENLKIEINVKMKSYMFLCLNTDGKNVRQNSILMLNITVINQEKKLVNYINISFNERNADVEHPSQMKIKEGLVLLDEFVKKYPGKVISSNKSLSFLNHYFQKYLSYDKYIKNSAFGKKYYDIVGNRLSIIDIKNNGYRFMLDNLNIIN